MYDLMWNSKISKPESSWINFHIIALSIVIGRLDNPTISELPLGKCRNIRSCLVWTWKMSFDYWYLGIQQCEAFMSYYRLYEIWLIAYEELTWHCLILRCSLRHFLASCKYFCLILNKENAKKNRRNAFNSDLNGMKEKNKIVVDTAPPTMDIFGDWKLYKEKKIDKIDEKLTQPYSYSRVSA